jgi:hypothetical protein
MSDSPMQTILRKELCMTMLLIALLVDFRRIFARQSLQESEVQIWRLSCTFYYLFNQILKVEWRD